MDSRHTDFDAVVIGAGFYGSVIASYLADQRGLKRVLILERENSILSRASLNNQARVHNGYHYPRSFTTAYRSRVNLPRFVRDWPQAVKKDFIKLYAIARRNSKVTARQFERFCGEIGARITPASPALQSMFEKSLIESVYEVDEYAFDSTQLKYWALSQFKQLGIVLRSSCTAKSITREPENLRVLVESHGLEEVVTSRYVFNCTYSGLNQLSGDFSDLQVELKHELTEMCLIKPPPQLTHVGITVMDGPFFSCMPFPSRELHSLSHVRYTPHLSWKDKKHLDPYQKINSHRAESRASRILRDSSRYIPLLNDSVYIDSLLEVKTVLSRSEGDDGRPILFEKSHNLPGCFSILGGKIDNIYDILEKLDSEPIQASYQSSR
ncbi:MAG: D amino acid oxidase (DAO) family protein [Pseudomonas sp.]|nr:D amino acid oxidase (DAO) family protein [Pseudomonadales bacterium]MAK87866.1 D amino acid oxidase (DAO) family protein [Pseudomonas sp.]HCH77355.1 D amino acid oxidase (DAO) family protein [Pseudomonas sp.]